VTSEDERGRADPISSCRDGAAASRDVDTTGFTAILQSLVERIPGAYAAALVDALGETVDYAGHGDPFDVRVAAAHLRILLDSIARLGTVGSPRWLVLRGAKKSFAASAFPDGYALCVILRPRAAFTLSLRAWSVCARALAVEAGWPPMPNEERAWFPIVVTTDHRGRPVRIGDVRVEVLGTVMGLSVRERGFRVRTLEGSELMVVREGSNLWYADEPLESGGRPA
jgi:hypothetical protein